MLDEALKRRIQVNEFAVNLLLHNQFDEEQFRALCADLRLLAEQWREDAQIDEELASGILQSLIFVRNCADYLAPDRDGPVWNAYVDLDQHILGEVFNVPNQLRTWIPSLHAE